MALIFCSECGKQISDAAAVCPHCGAPIARVARSTPSQPAAETSNGMATAALVLGILSLIAWFLPLVGYPVTIIGVILGTIAMKKTENSKSAGNSHKHATIGGYLSAFGFVATLINSILGAAAFM